jgi:hypothetical protein
LSVTESLRRLARLVVADLADWVSIDLADNRPPGAGPGLDTAFTDGLVERRSRTWNDALDAVTWALEKTQDVPTGISLICSSK